jgi:hypothetical protein
MNRTLGWLLAALAVATGWFSYGWPGVVLAFTLIVFWLLLQFNRALRVMKNAASAPLGHVGSAVMLHSKLQRGWTMLQVVALTRSLGRKLATGEGDPTTTERWVWADAGGAHVTMRFDDGRLIEWSLGRDAADGGADRSAGPSA